MTTTAEAIPYLNAYVQHPAHLCDAMIQVFSSNMALASALIPTYAKHLTGAEFDKLGNHFPALSPLLNGYRQMLSM